MAVIVDILGSSDDGLIIPSLIQLGRPLPPMDEQVPLSQPSTPWRVSPENPPRDEGFDFERCAALHNEIVELGWVGSGRPLEELHQIWKSWFDHYGEAAEQVRHRMSDALVAFFERVRIIDHLDCDHGNHSFFFYVGSLSPPDQLWSSRLEESGGWGEPDQYLKLYYGNDLAPSHNDGLIFDQEEPFAILQVDIEDVSITHNGRQGWYSLEFILSAWLDMIDCGKIQAFPPDVYKEIAYGEYDRQPWVCHRWTPQGLEETIEVFNQLVNAIESQMPETHGQSSPASSVLQTATSETLLSEADADAANIPTGFARSFITTAKRPRFRYIAPGLAVPDPTSFSEQPLAVGGGGVDEQEVPQPGEIYSILLFRSSELFHAPQNFHQYPCRLPAFLAGLYLNWCDTLHSGQIFEDAVKLYLPFGIGANGYARTSDGGLFGEDKRKDYNPKGQDCATSLYQAGYRPFTVMHDVTLVEVLRSWLEMVERGDWKVGAEGVEGSIELFKEADTEEGWEKFSVPMNW